MKRAAIYAGAPPPRRSPSSPLEDGPGRSALAPESPAEAPPPRSAARRWWRWVVMRRLAIGAMALGLLLGAWWTDRMRPASVPAMTQEQFEDAVLHTLATRPTPSRAAIVAEKIHRSVVRVRGVIDGAKGEDQLKGVGSGVVILDQGVILTNLHVVAGTRKVMITFFDGTETEAELLGLRPENDLAIVKASKLPDDLPAATLGSTQGLRPGDEVVAVGFPFGIGPSVSAGVISGLEREFVSPEGKRRLTGLIQFDAAANPGNSGGPLVNGNGDVIGIVTAILNPTDARTFIGIGFAVTIESAGAAVGIPPF